MSIGSIFSNALTGLQASQTALTVVSQNISNANTPGYVRASAQFSPQVVAGAGAGVSVDAITRAADRFLAAAQRTASSTQGAVAARADLLDRAQLVFGDPNGDQTLFTAIDDVFTSFLSIAQDPSSTVSRNNAIAAIQDLLYEFSRAGDALESLRLEADQRLGEAVAEADGLLGRIADLNREVGMTRQSGGDSTGAENARDQLIDQLATLIDVRATAKADGVVELRTNTGALLVGMTAARLSYDGGAAAYGVPGSITINEGLPTESQFDPFVGNGKIAGLIAARDVDIPQLGDALASLAAELADALNATHAYSAGDPAAATLTGRQTGLLATDALNFSGAAVVGVVSGAGDLVRRITIDFDNGQIITENPADTRAFTGTVGNLVTRLNEVLQLAPAQGTASFVDGVLTIAAAGAGGVVLGEVEGNESAREGRGFAHFFGLNDLVRAPAPLFYEAGVSPADAHGLATGGALDFEITDANGRVIRTPSVAAAGTTWTDYLGALNNATTGIGQYATASIDGDGRLIVTPRSGYAVAVTRDTTERGATGVSVSELFGLTRAATATRALGLEVNAAITADAKRLGVGQPDLGAAIGARIVESGDTRGAQALSAVRDAPRSFAAAGNLSAQSTTLSLYASRLAGEAGRAAEQAGRAAAGADAVYTAATERRAQTEGVSLDDELVKMTQFQQSYAASSRVIQAAREMFDILVNLA
ncbi:MAG: flagellar hook-associated protein FlgK [Hyphomonadaceae bacterium]|nr:flagellar hook-associated protein FlgK [Hyphomonadaceae bacterium]